MLRHVVLGGWLTSLPDAIFCGECDHEYSQPTAEQGEAACALIEAVGAGSPDEVVIYERRGE